MYSVKLAYLSYIVVCGMIVYWEKVMFCFFQILQDLTEKEG